jgi:hypothetical protein
LFSWNGRRGCDGQRGKRTSTTRDEIWGGEAHGKRVAERERERERKKKKKKKKK